MRAVGDVTPIRPVACRLPANDAIEIPLHGRIAAGTPIEALQGTESFSVPAALLGPGEHYALEVSGDSMVDEGILDGDFALIRKADTARDGEIVVALIDDEEATLKTFRREGSMIRLDPANRNYEPQRYDPRRVQIQGRLAGIDPALLSSAARFRPWMRADPIGDAVDARPVRRDRSRRRRCGRARRGRA